ncbi:MAG: PepSY-associated TM helix domain-containing protein [Gammaproteobacteria bacterium]
MSHAHRRKQRFKLKSFYVWHRYMGVAAAFFTLILAVTGILLNHTERFDFDKKFITSRLILNWYDISAPSGMTTFETSTVTITQLGSQLYFGEKQLPGHFENLLGAVNIHELTIIAVNHGLSLFTNEGELIEQLRSSAVNLPSLSKIGSSEDRLIISAEEGLYISDSDFLHINTWKNASNPAHWSSETQTTAKRSRKLQQLYRNDILPVERILLDLHSGRMAGTVGVWLMDIAAILLVLLSLTGTWMWLKRRR